MSATSISVVGQPLQGLGDIAGPDAPCGTVSEFHHVAPIVLLDLHRRSPFDRSEPWMSQERRDAGHLARLLERLLGRRTDALTNFLANIRIVLRHLQDRVYSSTERPWSVIAFARALTAS